MADPGFPKGGRGPRRGGMDSRIGYVSKILHVEMKESGPLGGVLGARPLRSANVITTDYIFNNEVFSFYVSIMFYTSL